MDAHANTTKPTSENHHQQQHKAQPSTSQLMSSATVVADAAKSTLRRDAAVDKAKVAGAAADLLGAAFHYGKLEEKSFGRYVEQAEGYLHKYQQSSSSSSSSMEEGEQRPSHPSSSSAPSKDGFGNYLKLAQGFLKKR